MMTGNGVMHNGTTILDEYGHNLDRLKARLGWGEEEEGAGEQGGSCWLAGFGGGAALG